MPRNRTMTDIFTECQSGRQCHAQLVNSLQKIFTKMDIDSFWQDFLHHLKYSLIVFNREPSVERTIDFVSKFCVTISSKKESTDADDTSDDVSHNVFLQKMLDFLLQSHSAKDRAVRFRCCQMINKLLNNLGDDALIDDELYDKIYEAMLARMRDKIPVVRVHAVQALSRLQDPSAVDCQVIKAYLFLMGCDPNSDVRRTVLTAIAPSTKTLPGILERTRDIKDIVRRVAFEVISTKVHLKALSIAQRLQLLHDGLRDRSSMVQDACINKMLQAWLRMCGGNALDLLKTLDVEDSTETETCEQTLDALFKGSEVVDLIANFDILNDKCVIEMDKLSCESAFYWRCMCKYVHSLGTRDDEQLEKVLPNCIDFCDYVQSFLEKLRSCHDLEKQLELEFILQQILLIPGYMDLSDQAGRKRLQQLLHDMLLAQEVGHRLVKCFLPRLKDLFAKPELLVNYVSETVSEIREPTTVIDKSIDEEERRKYDIKIANIRVKMNLVRDELDDSIRNQSFIQAAELKTRIVELEEEKARLMEAMKPQVEVITEDRNDPQTILKCLTLICEMLVALPLKGLNSTLYMLIDARILPGIQHTDADVRNVAVRALGICCQLDKTIVLQYLPLFMQASQVDVEGVRISALHAIFDLLHTFGLDILQEGVQEKETAVVDESQATETTGDTTAAAEATSSMSSTGDTTAAAEATSSMSLEDKSEGIGKTACNLVMFLNSHLDSEHSEIRTVGAEGMAKLMLSGRVISSKIFSNFILQWYNPVTKDDHRLRHCLGAFFPVFAFASRSNQDIIEESVLPTLKMLFNAPSSSPLAEIDIGNVADFLVQLTNARLLVDSQKCSEAIVDHSIHDSLCLKVCNEILSNPDSFNVKYLVRILNQLELNSDNETNLKDLQVLCTQMLDVVKEKRSVKSLEKFQGSVTDLMSNYTRISSVTSDSRTALVSADTLNATEVTTSDTLCSAVENLSITSTTDQTQASETIQRLSSESTSKAKEATPITKKSLFTPDQSILSEDRITTNANKAKPPITTLFGRGDTSKASEVSGTLIMPIVDEITPTDNQNMPIAVETTNETTPTAEKTTPTSIETTPIGDRQTALTEITSAMNSLDVQSEAGEATVRSLSVAAVKCSSEKSKVAKSASVAAPISRRSARNKKEVTVVDDSELDNSVFLSPAPSTASRVYGTRSANKGSSSKTPTASKTGNKDQTKVNLQPMFKDVNDSTRTESSGGSTTRRTRARAKQGD